MLILKGLTIILLSASAGAQDVSEEEKYTEEHKPPTSGWQSAIKYFQKGSGNNTATLETGGEASDTSYDKAIFLDNIIFLHNRPSTAQDTDGRWGLNLGYEWDGDWMAKGVYLQYHDYEKEQKYSLLGGIVFPRMQSNWPVYLRLQAGLGYFTGAFDKATLSVDYNAYAGLRVYSKKNFRLNVEVGSKNYTRIFTGSDLNSVAMSTGFAVAF